MGLGLLVEGLLLLCPEGCRLLCRRLLTRSRPRSRRTFWFSIVGGGTVWRRGGEMEMAVWGGFETRGLIEMCRKITEGS